jgi:hypothetical protein
MFNANALPITITLLAPAAIHTVYITHTSSAVEVKRAEGITKKTLEKHEVSEIVNWLSRLTPDLDTPVHEQGNHLRIESPLFSAEYKWPDLSVRPNEIAELIRKDMRVQFGNLLKLFSIS